VAIAAIEAGWAALREGRWQDARAAFAAGESPAALEGLSWAAWWLDDADGVFDARERAFRLYRSEGDRAGAARMATWLGADALDFQGAGSVANGWLQRAHRLLDGVEPCPEHGWLAFHDGYIAYAGGDHASARDEAVTAAAIGRHFEVADLEMLGLALEGAALVASAEVAPGMQRLDEAGAIALTEETVIPISAAWTCCMLVGACTAVRDFDRAGEWCDRVAEFAARFGSRYMLGYCRSEYGAIALWRGRWDDAEALLDEAIEAFTRSRPPWVSGPLAGLAELRRRQGRREEAAALLERAGPTRAVELCRARLALDVGDPTRAAELAERLRRRSEEQLAPAQADVLELLTRAAVAGGEFELAAEAAAELRALASHIATPPLHAAADLAAGRVEAARGEHARARTLLEDAVDCYDRCGAPYEAAQARAELATTLFALGRDDQAAAERDRASAALGQLTRPRRDDRVTPREREVLRLLAEGLTNREIAERLVLSEHTVHRHVANILRKLGLPSRTAAATEAVRSGLLDE
jgi:LuxR family transcriptional regulator, maltose regulon positive regulatory protein